LATSNSQSLKPIDWADITDAEERRRVQNRIAQRSFREKLKENKERWERDIQNQILDPSNFYQMPPPPTLDQASEMAELPWGSWSMPYHLASRSAIQRDVALTNPDPKTNARPYNTSTKDQSQEKSVYENDQYAFVGVTSSSFVAPLAIPSFVASKDGDYKKQRDSTYSSIGSVDLSPFPRDPGIDFEFNWDTESEDDDKPDVSALSLNERDPTPKAACNPKDDSADHAETWVDISPACKSKKPRKGLLLKLDTSNFSSQGDEDDGIDLVHTPSDILDTSSSNGCYSDSTDHSASEIGTSILKARGKVIDDMIDRVMDQFWQFYDQEWDFPAEEDPEDADAPTGNEKSTEVTSQSSSTSQSKRRQLKRSRGDGNDDAPADEDNNGLSRLPDDVDGGSSQNTKFACPFRKHDPYTYSVHTHKICALSPWPSISRLKEHLYRVHKQPIHCKRCWMVFKTPRELDDHMMVQAAEICEIVKGQIPDGITGEQELHLRSRKKKTRDQTDEDRWRDIYKLLFPTDQVPSPYFTPVDDQGSLSPDSRDLLEYESFLRREMPRLVRSTLEQEANSQIQPIEQALIESLPQIIQECQESAFRAYRRSRTGRSTSRHQTPRTDEASTAAPESLNRTELPPDTELTPEFPEILDSVFQSPPVPDGEVAALPVGNHHKLWDSGFQADSGYGSVCNCVDPCVCWLFGLQEQ
jgi:hypothetical protein